MATGRIADGECDGESKHLGVWNFEGGDGFEEVAANFEAVPRDESEVTGDVEALFQEFGDSADGAEVVANEDGAGKVPTGSGGEDAASVATVVGKFAGNRAGVMDFDLHAAVLCVGDQIFAAHAENGEFAVAAGADVVENIVECVLCVEASGMDVVGPLEVGGLELVAVIVKEELDFGVAGDGAAPPVEVFGESEQLGGEQQRVTDPEVAEPFEDGDVFILGTELENHIFEVIFFDESEKVKDRLAVVFVHAARQQNGDVDADFAVDGESEEVGGKLVPGGALEDSRGGFFTDVAFAPFVVEDVGNRASRQSEMLGKLVHVVEFFHDFFLFALDIDDNIAYN